jgi:hypothetical protein
MKNANRGKVQATSMNRNCINIQKLLNSNAGTEKPLANGFCISVITVQYKISNRRRQQPTHAHHRTHTCIQKLILFGYIILKI